jgi:hypothetical protein
MNEFDIFLIVKYLEKSAELVDSAKHTAHEASVKLEAAGSEIKAKGSEILGATQQALATGAAAITEKAKQGIELASETASNVKAATGQLAADVQAKVAETAHNAQGLYIFQ